MDSKLPSMMLNVALLIIGFTMQGTHTTSQIGETFPRENPDKVDFKVPDFEEQTGSSLPPGDTQGVPGSGSNKREIEQRGKKRETRLVDKWTMYKANGDTFQENIRSLCLSAHRFLRRKHLRGTTVKYKRSLQRDAEQWAKHLAEKGLFEHSDGIYRDYGENIYKLDNNYNFVPNPVIAVSSWYSESWQPRHKAFPPSNYDYSFNPSSTYEIQTSGVGHFTQLIWDESVSIGCGAASTTYKRGAVTYTTTLIVARYLVPGNQVLQFPRHVFPLRSGAKTLEGLKLAKLFPGKKDCVDSVPTEVCQFWKRLNWCDRDWAITYCECTCTGGL